MTDTGGLNDRSFNHLAYVGLQRAKADLGATVSYRQSNKTSDYVPNLQNCAASGANLVIGNGFLMENQVGQVAKQFSNVHFAIIDDSVSSKGIGGLKNVQGLLFKEQESGYLAGYLAGLMEKKGGARLNSQNVMSTVGGLAIPPVDHYIAGFQAGAKKADPGVKLLNGYSQDFNAQDKCKNLAETQITRGSDVVFQVAGGCGLGAILAAKEHKYWAIGVDADQGYLGPHILVSAIKRVDQAVFDTAKQEKDGTFAGGKDSVFGLAQNGTGIAGINKAVPASIKAQVAKVEAQIRAGKLKPPSKV